MTDSRIHKIKFATDLCTFYNPRYWGAKGGYDNMGDLFSWGKWDEFGFWERIFNDVAAAGLDGIEITFPPGDYHSATRAYGSAQGFADRVKQQGLEICSGFLSTRVPGSDRRLDFGNVDDRAGLVELAE